VARSYETLLLAAAEKRKLHVEHWPPMVSKAPITPGLAKPVLAERQ
jgi:hypothetical protein